MAANVTTHDLHVQPTITVRPGWPVRVLVSKDLVLQPWRGSWANLKLARLPDRTPVKVTILISPDLHQALGTYAELYAETYGAAEPVQELIPAMLANFLESDRAFILHRKKAKSSSPRSDQGRASANRSASKFPGRCA